MKKKFLLILAVAAFGLTTLAQEAEAPYITPTIRL
jgi:hypothetical protein